MLEKINLKNAILKIISLRDTLLIVGMLSLGYGLYMVKPWISFVVCGGLLIFGGLIMQEK